jgi:dynein heavy chain 1, cytosolic
VCARLGEDLDAWQRLLLEAKSARAMIESGERSQSFGPLVVDYAQVQTKVGLKYDTWQSELQERFAALLNTAAHDQLSTLVAAKAQLEQAALEGGTADVIASVTCVQDMRRKARSLQEQVSSSDAQFSNACF